MNRKRMVIGAYFIGSFILFINIFSLYFNNMQRGFELSYSIKASQVDDFQVFYKTGSNEWSEEKSTRFTYSEENQFERMIFKLPSDINDLRLDFGQFEGELILKNLILSNTSKEELDLISSIEFENQITVQKIDDEVHIRSLGNDPYVEVDLNETIHRLLTQKDMTFEFIKYILSLSAAILVSIAAHCIKDIQTLLKELVRNKQMIIRLAKNDFKTKYVSSYLGTIWAFINPLVIIGTYWFVFQVGFRSTDVGDTPFILWFICGIVPWFFFSEALGTATNSLLEYNYLVKKVVFKIEMLPILKILAAFFVHIFFIGFLFVIYIIHGYSFNLYNLQVIYYLFCLIVFLTAVSTLTSSILLFFRDLNQIIGIILNVGFWFTPIGWPNTMLSEGWRLVFKLNPMYYIVEGYRDSFVNNLWFFQRPYHMFYFWVLTLIILFISVKLFKKLKVHFADVI